MPTEQQIKNGGANESRFLLKIMRRTAWDGVDGNTIQSPEMTP
jgi:hypothetical protein